MLKYLLKNYLKVISRTIKASNNILVENKKIERAGLRILTLIQIINGASVSLPQLTPSRQAVNISYYEYIVDKSANINYHQNDLSNRKTIKMEVASVSKVNLTALTWAHAVNSQELLTEALNSDIDFIEADIVMGKLNNSGVDLPVMAHPPANTSDISLDSFLLQIKYHNDNNTEAMKGVKLDFKSIEVFEGALSTLKEKIPEMSYPVWLNADIIKGPINQNSTTPVDPERFFAGCANFPEAVLSIGWTTRWTSEYNNGSYAREELEAMQTAINSNNVRESGQPITFPVRAGIAANTIDGLHDLVGSINDTNECTLTIWSSQSDYVDVDKLRKLIFSFGLDRVYLDVPEELSSQLDLSRTDVENDNGNAGSVLLPSLVKFSLMGMVVIIISLWLQKIRI